MSSEKRVFYKMTDRPNSPTYSTDEETFKSMLAKHPRSFVRVKEPSAPVTKTPKPAATAEASAKAPRTVAKDKQK